jgi:ribonuclease E
VTRRMLINAQRPEELRIAIVRDSILETYQVEAGEASQTRSNIYRGVVASIQGSLNAAFIDYGAEKNGFLSLDNLMPELWHHRPAQGKRARIEDVLDRGKTLIVQIAREPEGQKGAALTTNISLPGRHLVFTPFDDTQGVSRKVEDEDTRRELKEIASGLRVPEGAGVIIRTNAVGQNKTTLTKDIQALVRLWKQIQAEAKKGSGPKLLQSDQDLILRTLRDYVDSDIDEILIDDEAAWEKAREYFRTFLPRSRTNLVRYAERTPLFAKFGLEPQIDRIYDRSVPLPGGGSIVIDRTEALIAIDVNSGRSKGGSSHEETVVATNMEAAREVGRHLQLRDIGGLIVVDFIDMKNPRNRRKVEAAMKEALKTDKARTSVGRLSSNGLLEINRQKIRQALHLRTHRACPTCEGTGRIASPEMVSLNLLRRIEARATTSPVRGVRVELHPELADFLQNSRRRELAALEEEFKLRIEIIAASHLHRPEQEVEWFEGAPEAAVEATVQAPTAAAPAAQHEQKEAQTHPSGKKKRRRRRRRGRDATTLHDLEAAPHAEAAPAPEEHHDDYDEHEDDELEGENGSEVEQEAAETQHDDAHPEGAQATNGRKRRRRRRRRGGREGVAGQEASTQADGSATGPVEQEDEPPFALADPDAVGNVTETEDHEPAETSAEGPKRKRRRRRGGRGRSGEHAAAENGEEAAAPMPAPEEIEVEAPPEPVPVEAAAPKEIKVARSRRTPRPKKAAASKAEPVASAQPDSGEAVPTSFWEETALEEKPAPKPRKSRRRSKPADKEAGVAAAVEPSPDES